MIRLTELQWEDLTSRTAERVVADWPGLPSHVKTDVKLGLRERLEAVYLRLPPDAHPMHFPGMEEIFRAAALDLIVNFLKKTMIYQGRSDDEVRASVGETAVRDFTLRLMGLAGAAHPFLPRPADLAEELDHVEEWDLDGELARLIAEDSPE